MPCSAMQKKAARGMLRRGYPPSKAWKIAKSKFVDLKELILALREVGANDDAVAGVRRYIEKGRRILEASDTGGTDMPEWTQNEDGTWTAADLEVFRAGTWKGVAFGRKDLEEIVRDTNAIHDRLKPVIKLGHKEAEKLKQSAPALGWIGQLRLVGDVIRATATQIPGVLAEAVRKGRYKRGSAELIFGYREPSSGQVFPKVLRAFAFLGAPLPAITTLGDIAAFEHPAGLAMDFDFGPGANDPAPQETKPPLPEEAEHKEEVSTLTDEERKEMERLRAFKAEHESGTADLAKDRKSFAERLKAEKARKIAFAWGELVKAQKAKPADEQAFKVLALAQDDAELLIFTDADGKEVKKTALDCFLEDKFGGPIVVKFGQKSKGGDGAKTQEKVYKFTWEDPENRKPEKVVESFLAFTDHVARDEKISYDAAMVRVEEIDPELVEAYLKAERETSKGASGYTQDTIGRVIVAG